MILKNRNKGFTFIELILYMAILGIFIATPEACVKSVSS